MFNLDITSVAIEDPNKQEEPKNILKEVDLVKVFTACLRDGLEFAGRHRQNANYNEQMVNGNQFIGLDNRNDKYYIQQAWYNDIPKKSKCILANFALTHASLLARDRPSVYGVKNGNSISDESASELTTKLIEYFDQELNVDDFVYNAILDGDITGTSVIAVCYEANDIELDDNGKPLPSGFGDLNLKNYNVNDYYIDPHCKDFYDSPWYIFRDQISVNQAKEEFEVAGFNSGMPSEGVDYDGHNQRRIGIFEYRFWHKPCLKYPKGMFARIIGNRVLDYVDEYPLTFFSKRKNKEIYLAPGVTYKCRTVRGSPYGRTFITDAVPHQTGLNETLSRLFKSWRQTSAIDKLVPKNMQHNSTDESSVIWIENPEIAEQIRFITPPPVPEMYDFLLKYFEQAMYDTTGISETTLGQQESASKSGRAMLYQAQLDSLKTRDSVNSMQDMVERLYDLLVKIFQKYCTLPMALEIFDDENKTSEIINLMGSDIDGIDVRLESRSANEGRQANKEQDAMEKLQQGLVSPAKADSLVGSMSSLLDYKTSQDLVQQYIDGNPVNIEADTVNPETMIQVIEDFQQNALLGKQEQVYHRLQDFKEGYVKMVMAAGGGGGSAAPSVHNTSAQAVSEPATAPNVFGPQAGKPQK